MQAIERILGAVAPPVLAVTRVVLGPRHPDLEDVVQESLLAIHAAVRRFRGESSFVHYARRIAVRTALAARRRPSLLLGALDEEAAADPMAPAEPAPEALAREERLEAFRVLLDELPVEQAESLAMRIVLGHSLPQIAEATGAPVNTVRSRIRLAKETLRTRIVTDPGLIELFEVEP
jgi:RNA polymerase sigma-70 factor (ECF subfamily)